MNAMLHNDCQLTSSVEFWLAFCFASLRESMFPVLTNKLCESISSDRHGILTASPAYRRTPRAFIRSYRRQSDVIDRDSSIRPRKKVRRLCASRREIRISRRKGETEQDTWFLPVSSCSCIAFSNFSDFPWTNVVQSLESKTFSDRKQESRAIFVAPSAPTLWYIDISFDKSSFESSGQKMVL